jgi:uncharacterized protein (TIGR00730 family)
MSIIKKPELEKRPKNADEMPAADICPVPYEDFRSGASWRIFRIMAEFIEGFEFLADLKKEVSIFIQPQEHWYKEARKLGHLLGSGGYSMVTGGGPGIMEAANRGAYDAGAPSIGLNIELPMEQRTNRYVKKSKAFHYFFTRKVMLSASAQAYVFFPGGFGTLDEASELITLIQTKKMCPIPIVLVGKEFWDGFLEWSNKAMLDKGYISKEDMNIFKLVDSADEAFEILKESVERPYF